MAFAEDLFGVTVSLGPGRVTLGVAMLEITGVTGAISTIGHER
jgi:hypothetical protein